MLYLLVLDTGCKISKLQTINVLLGENISETGQLISRTFVMLQWFANNH